MTNFGSGIEHERIKSTFKELPKDVLANEDFCMWWDDIEEKQNVLHMCNLFDTPQMPLNKTWRYTLNAGAFHMAARRQQKLLGFGPRWQVGR